MDTGPSFNAENIDTPVAPVNRLFSAIEHGREEEIVAILKQHPGAGDWRQEGSSSTALQMSMVKSRINITRILLATGANPEDQNSETRTTAVMTWAMGFGDFPLRELLERGGTLDSRDHAGFTPLMYAAHSGRMERALELVAAGSNPLLRNDKNETAQMIALRQFAAHGDSAKERKFNEIAAALELAAKEYLKRDAEKFLSKGLGKDVGGARKASFQRHRPVTP